MKLIGNAVQPAVRETVLLAVQSTMTLSLRPLPRGALQSDPCAYQKRGLDFQEGDVAPAQFSGLELLILRDR